MYRKIGAWALLILLIVVPFLNWRLGALLWMCAWVTYICQSLFNRNLPIDIDDEERQKDNTDEI
jgi:hypothetical protein